MKGSEVLIIRASYRLAFGDDVAEEILVDVAIISPLLECYTIDLTTFR